MEYDSKLDGLLLDFRFAVAWFSFPHPCNVTSNSRTLSSTIGELVSEMKLNYEAFSVIISSDLRITRSEFLGTQPQPQPQPPRPRPPPHVAPHLD